MCTIVSITYAVCSNCIYLHNGNDLYNTFNYQHIYLQTFISKYDNFSDYMVHTPCLLMISFSFFSKLVISLCALIRIHKTPFFSLYLCIQHTYYLCFSMVLLQKLKTQMEYVQLLSLQTVFFRLLLLPSFFKSKDPQ